MSNNIYHKHHIIPKHMGGSDDPSNIMQLTIHEHADAHKKLYEEHGCWQDYIAWKGLLGLISHEDCLYISALEGGKKGAEISNKSWKDPERKKIRLEKIKKSMNYKPQNGSNNYGAKEYIIIHPNGFVEIIKSLKTWCEENGFKHNTLHKACICRNKAYKGYIIKKYNSDISHH